MKQKNKVKRLEMKIKAYEEAIKMISHEGAYTKPGSLKKC